MSEISILPDVIEGAKHLMDSVPVSGMELGVRRSAFINVSEDSQTPSSPVVYNNNFGSGVFNHVVGTQVNYGGVTTIVQCAVSSQPDHVHEQPDTTVTLSVSYKLEPFYDAIEHIDVINDFLVSQLGNSDSTLAASFVYGSLLHIRDHLSYSAKAFGLLIGAFPETIRSFRYFRQFEDFIQRSATPLIHLRNLIHSHECSGKPSSNRTRVLDYLAAHHEWLDTAKSFLEAARPELECFLRIVSSRWVGRLEGRSGRNTSSSALQLAALSDEIRRACHPTFRHLRFDCFFLKDHLGNQVPIPLVFCGSWTEVNLIIRNLCKGLEGADYILKDLWELVRADDTEVIDRDEAVISQVLLPESVYEISIILRLLGVSATQCPQCKSSRLENDENGWRACLDCGAKFQMSFLPGFRNSSGKLVVPPLPPPPPKIVPPKPSALTKLGNFLNPSHLLPSKKSKKRIERFDPKPTANTIPTSNTSSSSNNPADNIPGTSTTQAVVKFHRVSVYVPHGSLEWARKFLEKLLGRCNPLHQQPPPGLELRHHVWLLVKEILALPPIPYNDMNAPRRRNSLAELLDLVDSIEHHFPAQQIDMAKIVASIGRSLMLPRRNPHGSCKEELGQGFRHSILWGWGTHVPTVFSVCSKTFCQWSPFSDDSTVVPLRYSQKGLRVSAIHRSGRYVALAYRSGAVRVFDTSTGAVISTNKIHKAIGPVHALVFSPSGSSLAAASNTITILDIVTGNECAPPMEGHKDQVLLIDFSPDACRLVSMDDFLLYVWDATTGQALYALRPGILQAVSWSPDGKHFACAFSDERNDIQCGIRDAETGEEVMRLADCFSDVLCLAFSPDGKQLVAGMFGNGHPIQVWDVESGRSLAVYNDGKPVPTLNLDPTTVAVACSQDGRYIAAMSDKGGISIWAT
ncbi:hypothetical protein ONZ45_g12196 [Pleurotus djamor]|nr:hypothetical protein ONZ45_g12196 [Pleurotus djamor]